MAKHQATAATMITDVGDQRVSEIAYRIIACIADPARKIDPRNVEQVSDVLIRVFESGYTAGVYEGKRNDTSIL